MLLTGLQSIACSVNVSDVLIDVSAETGLPLTVPRPRTTAWANHTQFPDTEQISFSDPRVNMVGSLSKPRARSANYASIVAQCFADSSRAPVLRRIWRLPERVIRRLSASRALWRIFLGDGAKRELVDTQFFPFYI